MQCMAFTIARWRLYSPLAPASLRATLANAGAVLRMRSRRIHAPIRSATPPGDRGGGCERRSRAPGHHRGAAGRPAVLLGPRRFSSRRDGAGCSMLPPASQVAPARRYRKGAHQQSRARRLEASLGCADPDGARSRGDASRCPGRLQVARCRRRLPASTRRIEKETEQRVKKALHEARAAVVLYSADARPKDKIAAIAVIRERGDQDALGLIDGLPADTPPAVRQAPARPAARSGQLGSGAHCRMPGTACRSARCCCSPRSGSRSPSASWASSTWRMAKW